MQWNEFSYSIRHLSTSDQKMVQDAFELGAKMHETQKRLSGEPYFTHPIAVARILADMGADRDTVVAALLHDTVEDTPLTLSEIVLRFNPVVGKLIDGVTKLGEQDIVMRPSLNEQIETLRKMFNLMQTDIRIMVIKLADRLHNMQTISFRTPEKQKMVARETLDIYVKIADRLCMRNVRDDLEGICLSILDAPTYPALLELRKKNEDRANVLIPSVHGTLSKKFNDPSVKIFYESRSWENLRKQYEVERNLQYPSPINLSIVCRDVEACYQTLGMLHQLWRRETLSFQDYINAPHINGYKSLHTTVILENGQRIRCKIRTNEMHEYAQKGITTLCFDGTAMGILNYLPWTTRISSLSKDTTDRSEEYWASLQSDILGESILIHGEGDQTQLLPSGASTLDGVFYLYGEKGLKTKEIFIDGKPASFYETLHYATTVNATFAASPQVQLKWLQFSHTGIGTALIRKGLAEQEAGAKKALGQQLLQEYFSSRRRGFISEFDPAYVTEKLRKHGIESIDELYIRIAEGRISVQEIEQYIFETDDKKSELKEKKSYILVCTVPKSASNSLRDALQYYTVMRFKNLSDTESHGTYRLELALTEDEYETFKFTLDHVLQGNYKLRRKSSYYQMSIVTTLLFLLWGLDPVFAHLLLKEESITPIDMTVVRFFTLSLMSGLFLLWIRMRQRLPEVRLSLRNSSLWLSVICLFSVAVTTYYSLLNTLPSHYTIPMTSAGLLLTTVVNRHRPWTLAATWTLVAIGVGLLMRYTENWDLRSIGLTLLAVVSFTAFSFISERYKRQEKVALRAAQYFFLLSALCMILSLSLIPLSTLSDISSLHFSYMILFSIFANGLPYYIYYYLLSYKEIDFVLRYSFLIIPVSVFGQDLFIGISGMQVYLAALLVIIGAVLPLVHFKRAESVDVRLPEFTKG